MVSFTAALSAVLNRFLAQCRRESLSTNTKPIPLLAHAAKLRGAVAGTAWGLAPATLSPRAGEGVCGWQFNEEVKDHPIAGVTQELCGASRALQLKYCCALVVATERLNWLWIPITGALVTVIHVALGRVNVVSSTNPAVFVGQESVTCDGEDWVRRRTGNSKGVGANDTVNKEGREPPFSWVCVSQVVPPLVVH